MASRTPWKTLLEAPARAAWRVSEAPAPPHIIDSYELVLSGCVHTSKQLRRAHQRTMQLHVMLSRLRESERKILVDGSSCCKSDERMSGGRYFVGKRNDKRKTSDHLVMYGNEQSAANVKFRFLPNYAVVKRVLQECQSLIARHYSSPWKPRRVIDFGMGCGSATAAAVDVFGPFEWVHGIEPSHYMRQCSRVILRQFFEAQSSGNTTNITSRITYGQSLSNDKESADDRRKFDLALLSYSGTDLLSVSATLAAAASLYDKLQPNGVLIMIEPGTPDGFRLVQSVRNMLLECCCTPDKYSVSGLTDQCHILAPCTHNSKCPLVHQKQKNYASIRSSGDSPPQKGVCKSSKAENIQPSCRDEEKEEEELMGPQAAAGNLDLSFCSFVQTMPGECRNYRGEKFSYLVVQKRNKHQQDERDNSRTGEGADVAALLAKSRESCNTKAQTAILQEAQNLEARYLDSKKNSNDELGLELLGSDPQRMSYGRIIRAPKKKRGHVYIDYCASGKITTDRITKSSSIHAPGIYAAARKSRWGGFWPSK